MFASVFVFCHYCRTRGGMPEKHCDFSAAKPSKNNIRLIQILIPFTRFR